MSLINVHIHLLSDDVRRQCDKRTHRVAIMGARPPTPPVPPTLAVPVPALPVLQNHDLTLTTNAAAAAAAAAADVPRASPFWLRCASPEPPAPYFYSPFLSSQPSQDPHWLPPHSPISPSVHVRFASSASSAPSTPAWSLADEDEDPPRIVHVSLERKRPSQAFYHAQRRPSQQQQQQQPPPCPSSPSTAHYSPQSQHSVSPPAPLTSPPPNWLALPSSQPLHSPISAQFSSLFFPEDEDPPRIVRNRVLERQFQTLYAQRTSLQHHQQQPPPSTPTPSSTRVCQPSIALYSQRGFSPSSATPWVNGSTMPRVDRLPLSFTTTSSAPQPSPPIQMPSTWLPPPSTRTSTQVRGPPPLALEDPELWEKVLQAVAMLMYAILRCALVPLSVQPNPLNLMYRTQPLRCNVERQCVQQQSDHESSTHDRHYDGLLCRRPSLADNSTASPF